MLFCRAVTLQLLIEMENTNETDYLDNILKQSQSLPVVVDFWAPWCEPCFMLEPILNELESENQGRWKLIKINIDEMIEIAGKYSIRSVPTVCIFHKGEMIAKYNGLMWKKQFGEWIEGQLNQKLQN